jgi:hypothetical protein
VPGKHLTNLVWHFVKEKRRRAAAVQNLEDSPTLLDSRQRPGLRQPSGAFALAVLFAAFCLKTAFGESTNSVATPKFLGSPGCSSSSCHGGASEKSKQYTIWSTHDFHHARPYATLETARSERLAEVLKNGNAAQSPRCTVCHAPFATVPAERLAHDAHISEGVSCESCHGPAENWIRSHTRPDYTHADRVAAGMRDLNNLYVRANTCVACHQNIDPEIRAAGHPELIFEMDGQSVTMPRHWREKNPGSQSWFVGQAVAARELSWELSNEKSPDRELVERWSGLVWVLGAQEQPTLNLISPSHEDFEHAKVSYDRFAKQFAEGEFSIDPVKAVGWLASSGNTFADKNISKSLLSRRAERLVLALDRLLPEIRGARANDAVNQSLNKLFADAQSLPDFDPNQFAKDLNTFHSSVAGFLEIK